MNNKANSTVILTILDGWGHSEKIKGNAIKLAHTPTIDEVWNKFSHSLLSASGKDVGLPKNQMGNSEVGHTTIGAGRIINQDLVRIEKSISNGDFFNNETIHDTCKKINNEKSKLHIIGLCSDGGVHSHIDHLKATLDIVKEYKQTTCLHLITDGRDTEPKAAKKFIHDIENKIANHPNIRICSISGRYYSMDRDCRWSRTEKAYNILTEDNIIKNSNSNTHIIQDYYSQGISDEFIPPTKVDEGKISDNDGIIFFNFRPDRIRQLLHSFTKENFKGFNTKIIKNLNITTFTDYDSNINVPIIFPSQENHNFLGQIISKSGLKQLRLAETEKYAHVTYFFNGGTEEPFPGEDRELIPSPKVETYDLSPEMSAKQITESVIQALNKNIYSLIVVNYANTDMVGHTGNLQATIKSVNIIDKCINELIHKIANKPESTLIITSDHGNADYMLDKNNKPCKSHSTNPVPFFMIQYSKNKKINKFKLKPIGSLADIAPTILNILKLTIPKEMNGNSLLVESSKKKISKTNLILKSEI